MLIQLLIVVAVLAIVLWLVNAYVPRPASVVISVVLALILVIYTLDVLGLVPIIHTGHVAR
jgi:hypothetical protein